MKRSIFSLTGLHWKEVRSGESVEAEFELHQAGFVEMNTVARSESDWRVADYEASVLRLTLNGEYNQDCVLFYGDRALTYTRLLGALEPGTYRLRFDFNGELSSPQVRRAFIDSVELVLIAGDSELYEIYRHAPVLYGRNLYSPHDSRYTDTPLLMFYLTEQTEDSRMIEYQIMFSHEDEGTPTPLLMSKWGRTTDIEWVYRVVLDVDGNVRNAEFQGPHHKTTAHQGRTLMGGHPVLQVATANGMVHDDVTSAYRFLFPPVHQWRPQQEPRERVMDAYPFTYQVTAWEMLRQFPIENPHTLNSFQLADLRNYLYVQTAKRTNDPKVKTSIDIQVKLKGVNGWFSGSFGDLKHGNFRCAYDGPYSQFSTTVKLPPGTSYAEIEEICAVWLPGGEEQVVVPEFKAMFLDADYLPQPAIRSASPVTLTKEQPRQTLWQGNGR
ncbi:hypothetical protein ACFQI7_10080 [Paenibacillus allorhizosphaerae]|uniref:Uncharacterized protein n=1 Tax=Paenibacillus allorhizosphaerae TaxID=2849866 RepID=A0ABN7TQL4_9BACL|nr:hypothetical protein [Paenibacillus allorhizosphaerae]CAG7644603.1 hypothetical protein PAECIP111802_03328 [Paenibacillus allorhizosphaerae]